jgi:hypothetical protein
VLAIIFRKPMPSVSPYLNPNISAETWRIKTTKRQYFIIALCRFISGLKIFFVFIFTSNIHDYVMITPL